MAAIAAGAALSIGGSLMAGGKARSAARAAGRQAAAAQRKIDNIEATRAKIINPYDEMESVTGLAKDLTGDMSNPYASLGVATQAAEMQAEEADIALANTLDTMLATGAGAGGATALAQAALKSKQGVSASIEGQEAANDKLRAQGEQDLQKRQTAEAQRMQNIAMQDELRLQSAEAQGRAYAFESQEQRDENRLARLSGVQAAAQGRQASAKAGEASAFSGIASMGGQILGAGLGGKL
jgi:chromosome segregation ATPase